MWLKRAKVHQFRGIRSGELNGLADVNVLVGRNNCGKTTMCEAMCRCACVSSGIGDAIGRDTCERWSKSRNEDVWPDRLVYSPTDDPGFRIDLEAAGISTYLTGRITGAITTLASGPAIPNLGPVTVFFPSDGADRQIERTVWSRLLARRYDKSLVHAFNEVYARGAEGLQLLPDGTMMIMFADRGLPLDLEGHGARVALRCLMVLGAIKDSIFFLEEPECHQHPGALVKFATAICLQAKPSRVQLFLTTHSRDCSKAFVDAAETAQMSFALHHLTLRAGVLTAKRLDAAQVRALTASGTDVEFLDLYA